MVLAKGQRASQATEASDQLALVGYCSSKNTFFHGVKLHVVAQQRSGTLPLLTKAGLTPGSENDLRALRRVLPNIEGGVLCGDKAYCDGPLKERLAENQDLVLLTPVKKKRPENALRGRYPLFGGRKPDASTNRVPFQLDQRENRHSAGLEGTLVPGPPRSCLRLARRCNVASRSQPLIRIGSC
ncbi:transposase [Salinibacter ruber]|uniref:transposase n=1 Tax=Salinibacter ruber TaxID=146919 RepID=UPI003C6DFD7E